MANSLENSYSDPRFGTKQVIHFVNQGVQTSVIASDTEVGRHTFMGAVRVLDWNVNILNGGTQTGTAASARTIVSVQKSVGGTGANSSLGTVFVGGTHADNTVVDGSLTATDFDEGDDLIFQYNAGTGLAAQNFTVDAYVSYVERFV